jgi:hypothetical protein
MIIRSIEDPSGAYCIDFIEDEADGTFTFKLFRKDTEDYGRWSLTADYSRIRYASLMDAMSAAKPLASWFDGKLIG